MKSVEEVILVEGRYDKNALSQVVNAVILETGGFGIFKDKQKQALLRKLAAQRGLIVLTDPDSAGFVIRNFIKGCVPPDQIKQAYVPDLYGKEKRKRTPSKEGKLGVEGMRPEVLLYALERAGAHFLNETETASLGQKISKADLYRCGLSGGEGSREKRSKLLARLDLPERLTADGLLDVLNAIMSREEFFSLAQDDLPELPEQNCPKGD